MREYHKIETVFLRDVETKKLRMEISPPVRWSI